MEPDTSKGSVQVSFAVREAANENLEMNVWHVEGEGSALAAEKLAANESGTMVSAETSGFSYYTVEFTYDEKQYVMQGNSTVALTNILSAVGITRADGGAAAGSDISAASVSNASLFSASNSGGIWIVTAHQAFTTKEWIRVTVDGVEYEIVVTDEREVKHYGYYYYYNQCTEHNATFTGEMPVEGTIIYAGDEIALYDKTSEWYVYVNNSSLSDAVDMSWSKWTADKDYICTKKKTAQSQILCDG